MPIDRLVILPCEIFRGGFSSERVFHILLPEGEYVGAGPVEYFWRERGRRLEPDQPRERGKALSGYVDARIVSEKGNQRVRVSIPSGDVLDIDAAMTIAYPTESLVNVPIQP